MLVFTNGTIRTMDPARPVVEAVGIEKGRIVAVGTEAEVKARAAGRVEPVDLEAGALCPGFIDAHHHFAFGALLARLVRLDVPEVRSVGDILARVRAQVSTTPPGRWVLGGGYDEMRLAERRPPRREELDAACPDHPLLLLQYTYHEGVANTRGFREAGIPFAAGADPPHGIVERGARGAPVGRLVEAALSRINRMAWEGVIAADEETYMDALAGYQKELWARGVVRVFDPGLSPGLEAVLRRARARGVLSMPVTMMVVGEGGMFVPPLDRLGGAPTGEGDEWLRVGPLKLFMDGGLAVGVSMTLGEMARAVLVGARTALAHRTLDMLRMGRNVAPRLGRDGRFHGGILFYDVEEARRLCSRAEERGFSIAVHAIGNEAIGRALDAIPPSPAARAVGVPPNRIEHFSIIDGGHLDRAARKGIAAIVQPAFIERVGDQAAMTGFPGPDRFLALKSMLEAGLCVAGSSDAPVVDFDPLRAMGIATTRRTGSGAPFGECEKIGALDALALYTRNAAVAGGVESECGTIEPGKRADLVWLTRDPAAPGALDPGGTRVRGTWIGGERVV